MTALRPVLLRVFTSKPHSRHFLTRSMLPLAAAMVKTVSPLPSSRSSFVCSSASTRPVNMSSTEDVLSALDWKYMSAPSSNKFISCSCARPASAASALAALAAASSRAVDTCTRLCCTRACARNLRTRLLIRVTCAKMAQCILRRRMRSALRPARNRLIRHCIACAPLKVRLNISMAFMYLPILRLYLARYQFRIMRAATTCSLKRLRCTRRLARWRLDHVCMHVMDRVTSTMRKRSSSSCTRARAATPRVIAWMRAAARRLFCSHNSCLRRLRHLRLW
mmetsp:Transcript_14626/g.32874  ORF Transcript_14626/g.32874 Transcript_14626/m.32874 type:complete len:279 (+) Transcript_14626:2165-3001(+)